MNAYAGCKTRLWAKLRVRRLSPYGDALCGQLLHGLRKPYNQYWQRENIPNLFDKIYDLCYRVH